MKSKQRMTSRSAQLSLEHLEPRILLGAVNPGDPAVLYPGDQLFFVQGEDPGNASDMGGPASLIVIATYEGSTGRVEFTNGNGLPWLDNGDKIEDISFVGVILLGMLHP